MRMQTAYPYARHAAVRVVIRRAWPALAVLALLALSAAAPAPGRSRPAPPAQAAATCDPFSQSGPGESIVAMHQDGGIRQPLPEGLAVAACSLRVHGTGWTSSNTKLIEWDPLALAPDASTIALRAAFCDPSDMNYYTTNTVPRQVFVPPVVVRSVSGVAEAPRTTVAMEILEPSSSFTYFLNGYYEPEGDPAMPAAVMFGPAGSHGELTGSHPVAAYALCAGDADLDALRVTQCVRTTDALVPGPSAELVQRFRVPEPVDLRWVELAVNGLAGSAATGASAGSPEVGPNATNSPPTPPAIVGIVDATGLGDPPAIMPETLVESLFQAFFYKQPGPRWAAPLDFDRTVRLMPGRDYWLYVRSAAVYQFMARTLTGAEDANFVESIGAFHRRGLASDPWSRVPDQALAFKIVGVPTAPLAVTPRATFALRVSPTPARDAAEVTWSGAVAPVRLEVLDARGRRVAAGEGGAAGAWRIAAGSAGARPLPAGVYFVHARDSEGAHRVERLVIVR
jgi:hypothetical protein